MTDKRNRYDASWEAFEEAHLKSPLSLPQQQPIGHWWTNVRAATWLRVAAVLHYGAAKYDDSDGQNHQRISQADHLNHAITHLMLHYSGDRREPHLAHAVCRILFAMDVQTPEEITSHG